MDDERRRYFLDLCNTDTPCPFFSLPNLTWSNFFHLDSGWKFPLSLTIFGIAVALMGSGERIQVKSNPLDTYLPKQVRD
jgi:hypothetical protein